MCGWLSLQHVEMTSKVIKSDLSCCARKIAEICLFEDMEWSQWPRRGEIISCNGVLASAGAMIAPFSSDSMKRCGKNCR